METIDVGNWLPKIRTAFATLQIPHYYAGGIAVAVWGVPRATYDLDIVVIAESLDRETTANALGTAGVDAIFGSDLEFNNGVVRISRWLSIPTEIVIDFLILPSWWQEQARNRAVLLRKDSEEFPVVSAENLILMKVLSARQKDMDDIAGIVAVQKANLDEEYIIGSARRLLIDEKTIRNSLHGKS